MSDQPRRYPEFKKTYQGFIFVEVNWDYSHKLDGQPTTYEELEQQGFYDFHDANVKFWMRKHWPELYDWLAQRKIQYRGIQTGDTEEVRLGQRGFTVLALAVKNPKDEVLITLTWC